jgi:hypothetical protein
VVGKDVLKHTRTGPSRVNTLSHLRQMERVAKENEPLRRGTAGDRVSEAVTPGLVDDERVEPSVELVARE